MDEKTFTPLEPLLKKGIVYHLYMASITLLLMMLFGVVMLLNQGGAIKIRADLFYQLMTAHGTGMVGMGAMGGAAVMWYFLSKYLNLNPRILIATLMSSIIGVAMIFTSIFYFKFSDGWTFLFPLPAFSSQHTGRMGAYLFLSGLLLFGIGFLIMFAEIGRKIKKGYGSLRNGLGWDVIFGKGKEYGPPPAVVASTMVVICGTTALIAGAAVIVLSLLNIANPDFKVDPLLAKHLTYAFGHVFANCTIYMTVIGVYEILSRHANRPWKANKVFLVAWNFSTVFTLMIYTHHLLMDFVVPRWMLLIGQVFSYANGLPVMVVTAYGALMIIYRSGIKWKMSSGMMLLAMFGWVAGAIPAIIDATIIINYVMHNTKWVPGHFHTYMGLGLTVMIIAFMYYFNEVEGKKKDTEWDRVSAAIYAVFFIGLVGSFLYAGNIGTPRRWAEHLPGWMLSDIVGAVSACFVVLATLTFVVRFFINVRHSMAIRQIGLTVQPSTMDEKNSPV